MLVFIAVNLLIFMSWKICISALRGSSPGESIVYAGFLTATQIVSTELLLGMAGTLSLSLLLALNIGLSGGLLAWLLLARRASVIAHFDGVGRVFPSSYKSVLTPANVTLMVLGIFLTFWFCTAAYFLPPRGIDDLVSHLPPIYQYVQDHRISLLPIKLRDSFAMPQNGELLFLWPMIFFHADTFIDLVQYVVAIFGMFVVFALARRFSVQRNDAVFIGLLFLYTPLVLGQAGSNYVDLTVGVCYLALLYAVVRFWQTGAMFHLIMAGLATGFGLGIKYNMVVAVIAVQPLIIARLWRNAGPGGAIWRYGCYFVFSLPLCIFWFIRNFLATGYPLYPYWLDLHGLHVVSWSMFVNFPGKVIPAVRVHTALEDLLHDPVGFSLSYMFQDPGLGSFHGGFGAVFWGLGFPALIFCIYKAARADVRRDFFPLLFWGHVPLTFFVYFLQIHSPRLDLNQRLILVVIGFGLLALGIALQKLREAFPKAVPVIRSFCIAASMLAVVQLAGYVWPSFQLKQPVADYINDTRTSEYKYFAQSPWELPLLRAAWEPLDFLTRPGSGWSVYTAAPWSLSWTAPVFGSRIQNRVWNFQHEPENDPDAFIFHRMNDLDLYYVGKRITPVNVWSDGRYELVTQTQATQFWVKSSLLREPETGQRLVTWYARTFGPDIGALRLVADRLPDYDVLLTASPWGHGLKYLFLTGTIKTPVHLVPPGKVGTEARQLKTGKIITLEKPLAGYESKLLVRLKTANETVAFYENRVRR